VRDHLRAMQRTNDELRVAQRAVEDQRQRLETVLGGLSDAVVSCSIALVLVLRAGVAGAARLIAEIERAEARDASLRG
jgi:nitrogen fixation/metabolism regulation signal transduction histidine kinase